MIKPSGIKSNKYFDNVIKYTLVMDAARKKKARRNARVILTNFFMGLSVIAIVIVMVFIAMGYTFTRDGGLERGGLVQFRSTPTGATIEINGEVIGGRTNLNRMLSGGEHIIRISRPGYDTWERVVNVEAGYLLRLDWVRLFPLNRTTEMVREFEMEEFSIVSVAPTRQSMLIIPYEAGTRWQLLDVSSDEVRTSMVDVSTLFARSDGVVTRDMMEVVTWNANGNEVLVKYSGDAGVEWILVDLRSVGDSINLTRTFLMNFTDVRLASDSGDKLLVLENSNLRQINVGARTISAALATGVAAFKNNNSTVAYLTLPDEVGERTISILKENERGPSVIRRIEADVEDVHMAMGSYLGESWLGYSLDDKVFVLRGTYPSFRGDIRSLRSVLERELTFIPSEIFSSPNGRFIVTAAGDEIMTYDLDMRRDFR
jgi:hypothetical protein